jgi:ribosomal protein S18 acetylase RimI-like enzyme
LTQVAPFIFGKGEDAILADLLEKVYCGEGYTAESVARDMFRTEVLANCGKCFVARVGDEIAGVCFLVSSIDQARKIALPNESEVRLLAVEPHMRRRGIAQDLMQACIKAARDAGSSRLVLFTQTSMKAAHGLYEQLGFCRNPSRDLLRPAGGTFWVYERSLQES